MLNEQSFYHHFYQTTLATLNQVQSPLVGIVGKNADTSLFICPVCNTRRITESASLMQGDKNLVLNGSYAKGPKIHIISCTNG